MMDYAAPARLRQEETVRIALRVSPNNKPITLERFVYLNVLTLTGLAVISLLQVFITGNSWLPAYAIGTGSAELTLSLVECLLGAAALHLPMLIRKLAQVKIPDALCALFYIFVLCGTVLGEVFSLYYKIPIWDSILHASSGMMLGMLGSILVVSYFHKKKLDDLISPVFVAIAAVCFALCLGVFWEIYEFACDSLFGMNMQKSLLQDGTALVGKAAVFDTMKDLTVDAAGAIIAAASSYLSLKHKRGWLHSYLAKEPAALPKMLSYENPSLQYFVKKSILIFHKHFSSNSQTSSR